MARGESQAAWLDRMLARVRPQACYIRLEHKTASETECLEMRTVPKKIDADFSERLCEDFSDMAADACDTLYGQQYFSIVLHDKSAQGIGSKTWRVKGMLEEDPDSPVANNDAGFKQQLMMQNRFLFEFAFKSNQTLFAAMAEENVRLRAVEEQYHTRRLDIFKQSEDLLDARHERELEIIGLQSRQAKQERLFGLLEKTFGGRLRAAVAGVAAGATPGDGTTVEGVAVDPLQEFISSLSPEQQEKFIDSLTPEQQEKFNKIF